MKNLKIIIAIICVCIICIDAVYEITKPQKKSPENVKKKKSFSGLYK